METQVITSGRGQTVRIPGAMRLPSKQVHIVETLAGLLVIDPAKLTRARAALAGIRESVGGKLPAFPDSKPRVRSLSVQFVARFMRSRRDAEAQRKHI